MLRVDNRAGYGKLEGGEFSEQDEIQILKIIYAAACANDPIAAELRAKLMMPEPDTVRLLSYIHTSPNDQRPHITLLYPQPLKQQRVMHITATFNTRRTAWEYQGAGFAVATNRRRNFASGKDIRWSTLENTAYM